MVLMENILSIFGDNDRGIMTQTKHHQWKILLALYLNQIAAATNVYYGNFFEGFCSFLQESVSKYKTKFGKLILNYTLLAGASQIKIR